MGHDYRVSTALTADEFLAFRSVCDELGNSQSGRIRFLVKQDIRQHAHTVNIEAMGESKTVETAQELHRWQSIRQIGLPMFPQYPVGRFFVDFGDPKKLIAIECDGKQWHDAKKDAERDAALGSMGWTVYRLPGWALRKGEDKEDAAHHKIKQIFEDHYLGCDE